ncbi:MAG TPA: DEAD/DEAH box helicase family protein [Syntrophomonadaceae bacterium]|nr:DEAD/DEAH box helicase family protein [Syntrophomonadaceae bacterium]
MSGKIFDQNEDLKSQLRQALIECARLREENERLRALLGFTSEFAKPQSETVQQSLSLSIQNRIVTNKSSSQDKVAFFRGLFRGREDVYPVRWENKNGRSGYAPACRNEWNREFCQKPRIKCSECEHRVFLPVTDQVIFDHLAGRHTIGVYPLLPDARCWFLAADFDKKTWQEDSFAFLEACREMNVPAALERSRSGNGGHVWIFFEKPVPASLARNLGCAILTLAMERRHLLGLDSYDRFFPNQDTVPKGGFGNLIALPLQHVPRASGNSVFIDENFQPYDDQWLFLSTLRKMQQEEIETIVRQASHYGGVLGIRRSLTDEEDEEDPWTLPPSKKRNEKPVLEPLPPVVRLIRSNMVYVEKEGLPSAMINRLMRIAAFQNPEFYKAQAMRLPTYGKPRIIGCAEEFPQYIGLPRGCLDEVLELLDAHNVDVDVTDERFAGNQIDVTFRGELNILQKQAAQALLEYDTGILSATTAFGKTVVAAWLIATRKVNTLVLVHRRQLMDQWQERLAAFLDMPVKAMGLIGGGKDQRSGMLDIGIIQSLIHKGVVKDLVAEYGQVIVDECHHISAFSFEQVLKQVRARYVLGLTATPVRKDGHHPIIMMQCGPIRFKVDARKQAAARPFEHVVIPRVTDFQIPLGANISGIQDIYAALISDDNRNKLIFDDILKALDMGRSPILLTERTEHVEFFARRLAGFAKNVIVLRGGMGKKQRKALADKIASIPDEEERLLIATGRYIGEGFDDPRLDTLFLVMPISWRGTLQQYAGRLHRLHSNKRVVQIYDYVDANVPILARMYEKRLKGYKAMGYKVQESGDARGFFRLNTLF